MKLKTIIGGIMAAFVFGAAASEVSVTAVTAQQRYPRNKVDITVTIEGASNDVAITECIFAATNSITGAALTITNLVQNGVDSGRSFRRSSRNVLLHRLRATACTGYS